MLNVNYKESKVVDKGDAGINVITNVSSKKILIDTDEIEVMVEVDDNSLLYVIYFRNRAIMLQDSNDPEFTCENNIEDLTIYDIEGSLSNVRTSINNASNIFSRQTYWTNDECFVQIGISKTYFDKER